MERVSRRRALRSAVNRQPKPWVPSAPGVMIVQLNGAEAGQTVFHLHFHIIPRSEGLQLKFHARDMEKPDVLAAMAARIRAALG